MTREEMINQILTSIQDDVKLLKMLRLVVQANINNVDDQRLQYILSQLNGGQ